MEQLEKKKASNKMEELGKDAKENASDWTELVSQLVEKLTGRDMAITYEFENLVIDVPKATGPGGKELGSAKWKIDGKFVISSQLRDSKANEMHR
jgi:hypothetical protein